MFGIDVQQALHTFGYAAVALIIFIEDFGIPAPGETVLIAAAVEAAQGNLNVFAVALVAFVAAILGDNVGYAIGRYGGRPLVLGIGSRIHLGSHRLMTEERFDNAQSFFDRYGAWVIVVARFIEGLRQLNGIVAGTMRYGWTKFIALNALGAALWVGFWTIAAYYAGDWVANLHGAHRWLLVGGGAAAVVTIGIALYFLRWRRRATA